MFFAISSVENPVERVNNFAYIIFVYRLRKGKKRKYDQFDNNFPIPLQKKLECCIIPVEFLFNSVGTGLQHRRMNCAKQCKTARKGESIV